MISITAGPVEHLSVSVAQEATHLASDGLSGSYAQAHVNPGGTETEVAGYSQSYAAQPYAK